MINLTEPFLFHVSHNSNIKHFEPRLHTSGRELVWAIAANRLVNYLLPRDCPRICIWPTTKTSTGDKALLANSGHSIFIEKAWRTRAEIAQLYLYKFKPDQFALEDENAGYFTTSKPQTPIDMISLNQPLAQIEAMGATLKCETNLWPLAAKVEKSTLGFSMIRMRNALPIQSTQI